MTIDLNDLPPIEPSRRPVPPMEPIGRFLAALARRETRPDVQDAIMQLVWLQVNMYLGNLYPNELARIEMLSGRSPGTHGFGFDWDRQERYVIRRLMRSLESDPDVDWAETPIDAEAAG